MSGTIDTFQVGRCTVKIVLDDEPVNPRKEYDNVGTMVCWHRRYDLGDEQPKNEDGGEYLLRLARESDSKFDRQVERGYHFLDYHLTSECDRFHRTKRLIGERREKVLSEHYVILPLYLYDHSGITISTGEFSCPWDSGQVGFIYCSLEKAQHEWGTEDSKKRGWDGEASFTLEEDGSKRTLWEATIKYLEGEVEEYDAYLTGSCYGYIVEHENGEEKSCWGFLGDEKYCAEEARSVAEHMNERIGEEEKQEELEAADAAARDIVTIN